ncbi:MAG: RNA polymerase subunit sigma-70 [Bryobacterales bacterium]|nr:RNA polymerase subunit sigma-70 [Bryobacterales bacterium]
MSLEPQAPATITSWLLDWRMGNEEALAKLTAAVYQELHRMAAAAFRDENAAGVMQPTALVHELYLKLPDVQRIDWQSRGQFLAVASKMMRNILVDHARRRTALKRGRGTQPGQFVDAPVLDTVHDLSVLSVHGALDRFAEQYPRQASVVELRFFGGLTADETATALQSQGVESSLRSVERDWHFAKAWLHRALAGTN